MGHYLHPSQRVIVGIERTRGRHGAWQLVSALSWGLCLFLCSQRPLGERALTEKQPPNLCLLLRTYHEKPLVGIDDAKPDGHVGVLTVLQERANRDVPSCWVRLCKEKTETQGWHWAPFQQPGPQLRATCPPMSYRQSLVQEAFWTPLLCSHEAAFCLLVMIQPCTLVICILHAFQT